VQNINTFELVRICGAGKTSRIIEQLTIQLPRQVTDMLERKPSPAEEKPALFRWISQFEKERQLTLHGSRASRSGQC
jgi:hypothetical protein